MSKKDTKVISHNIKELLESGGAEVLPCIVDGEVVSFGVVQTKINKNEKGENV